MFAQENNGNVVNMKLDQDTDLSDDEKKIQFDEKSLLVYGDVSNRPIYCGIFSGKSVSVGKVKKNTSVSETYHSLLHPNHPNIIKVLHSDQDHMFKYLFIL